MEQKVNVKDQKASITVAGVSVNESTTNEFLA